MGPDVNRVTLFIVLLTCQLQANAFRGCEHQPDAAAFRGNSAYSVSELEFDALSRLASGTVTHYNYSNSGPGGLDECHVTYELIGVFEQSSALFLLEANRSNLSQDCDSEFVEARFPAYRVYTLQVRPAGANDALVLMADNGERIARAEWHEGYITFKSPEVCELL